MKQRIGVVDGIRGFSLIGILMANMLIFQYGMWGKDVTDQFTLMTGDKSAYVWLKIFVEGSFMPIFMFLFGYSMIKMKEKHEENGGKVKRHFFRRSLLLIILGALHTSFVWEGDILFPYGCLGLLLLLFLKRKKKTILIWAITLFALTSVVGFGVTNEAPEEVEKIESYVKKETQTYAEGSYSAIVEFRNSGEIPIEIPTEMTIFVFILTTLMLCPILLFGMYAAKAGWFRKPDLEQKLYFRYAVILVPGALLLKSIQYIFPDSVFAGFCLVLGGPLLAVGYLFAFALLYSRGFSPTFLKLFENVGRLSMTNYLMQSIICTTIFYGYGLGLFGRFGVINGILLTVGIYSLQVLCSHWYLKYWKNGPFEKIMRIGTNLSWSGKVKTKKITEPIQVPGAAQ